VIAKKDGPMSEPKAIAVDDPNEIAKMNQRQVKLGMLAQEVALAGLLELKQKMATATPLNMTADEAEKLLDVGLRLERTARGVPEPEEGHPLPDPPKRVH
jgi:hypothetical protein